MPAKPKMIYDGPISIKFNKLHLYTEIFTVSKLKSLKNFDPYSRLCGRTFVWLEVEDMYRSKRIYICTKFMCLRG